MATKQTYTEDDLIKMAIMRGQKTIKKIAGDVELGMQVQKVWQRIINKKVYGLAAMLKNDPGLQMQYAKLEQQRVVPIITMPTTEISINNLELAFTKLQAHAFRISRAQKIFQLDLATQSGEVSKKYHEYQNIIKPKNFWHKVQRFLFNVTFGKQRLLHYLKKTLQPITARIIKNPPDDVVPSTDNLSNHLAHLDRLQRGSSEIQDILKILKKSNNGYKKFLTASGERNALVRDAVISQWTKISKNPRKPSAFIKSLQKSKKQYDANKKLEIGALNDAIQAAKNHIADVAADIKNDSDARYALLVGNRHKKNNKTEGSAKQKVLAVNKKLVDAFSALKKKAKKLHGNSNAIVKNLAKSKKSPNAHE